MNSKEFSLIIEGVVKEKRPITYMDAILWYCEQNQIEVESVGRLISKALKEKIQVEALMQIYLKLNKQVNYQYENYIKIKLMIFLNGLKVQN